MKYLTYYEMDDIKFLPANEFKHWSEANQVPVKEQIVDNAEFDACTASVVQVG